MRYAKFKIRNFKGIRSLDFDLSAAPEARVHTLVGLNESGKTTVLEALSSFEHRDEPNPRDLAARGQVDPYDLIPLGERANFNGMVSVAATLILEDDDVAALADHLRTVHRQNLVDAPSQLELINSYRFADSKLSKGPSTSAVLAATARPIGSRRKPTPMKSGTPIWASAARFLRQRIPPIWYFEDFLFAFPDRIYLQTHGQDTSVDRFYRQLTQDILRSIDSDATIDTHLNARALSSEAADQKSLKSLLLKMGRRVTLDIVGAWDKVLNRNIADKQIRLSVSVDDVRGPYLHFEIEDGQGEFSLAERSLGFRWFFVFLLLTTYRGFRADHPPGMLMLLDEPASNLHSSAQGQLLESFGGLSQRCVVIYTTHSHHLINPNWLESAYVVSNSGLLEMDDYNARQTDIKLERYRRFASTHPTETHYFQPILDVLEYAPSRLELVPNAVMVEGKTDFYALRYMANGRLPQADMALIPGSGAGSLDSMIRLYVGWGREFIVLLDSDSAGRKELERYRGLFGPLVDGRLFLLEALVETNVTGIESLFEDEDRLAVERSVDPSAKKHSKKRFHRAIQELLATHRRVDLSSVTSARFDRLFEGTKRTLETVAKDAGRA